MPRLGGGCQLTHIIRILAHPLLWRNTELDNPVPEAGIHLPFGLFLQGQDIFVSVFKSVLEAARGKATC